MKKSDSVIKETENCHFEFSDNVLYVGLKEEADFTLEVSQAEVAISEQLVGDNLYTVIIDLTKNSAIPHDVRKWMANYKRPNLVASALLIDANLAAKIIVNFYLKFDKPVVPNKIFNDKDEAIAWLNMMLNGKVKSR